MNYGYQNEEDFVNLFNEKYFYELDDNSQKFLKELFGDVINKEEMIKYWKIRLYKRAYLSQPLQFKKKKQNLMTCILKHLMIYHLYL